MKTVLNLLILALIASFGFFSAFLYLQSYYNSSAILTVVSVVSVILWVKSHRILDKEQAQAE
jgi:hypothetical protein